MTSGGFHVNWTPIGLVLFLAMLGVWLNQVSGRIESVDNAGFTHDPDYIVENFDALAFAPDGAPQHRLMADRLTHFMDDDTTVLDKPRFRSLDSRATAEVNARRALISTDGKRVFFLKDVHISRNFPGNGPPITMDTEYLQVNPYERVMMTDRNVTLRQGRSVVTANKLLIDNNAQLLSLEGTVRGTYEHAR